VYSKTLGLLYGARTINSKTEEIEVDLD
jgi:hypothetical protein